MQEGTKIKAGKIIYVKKTVIRFCGAHEDGKK